jgi:CheY-like chemotaxis protein
MTVEQQALQPIWILEDDEDDFFLTKKALGEAGFAGEILWFNSTTAIAEALQTDFQDKEQRPKPPYFILVDLNMPGLSGFDFLDRSKGNPLLQITPKIVLSTSQEGRDVIKALEKGANSYIIKPRKYSDLTQKLQNTLNYFVQTCATIPWEERP